MKKYVKEISIKWTGNQHAEIMDIFKAGIDVSTDGNLLTLKPYKCKTSITVSVGSTIKLKFKENGEFFFTIEGAMKQWN